MSLERYSSLLGISLENGPKCKAERDNSKILEYFGKIRSDLVHNEIFPEIAQWLFVATSLNGDDITFLNDALISRTFVTGNKLSLADVIVFDAISCNTSLLAAAAAKTNVARWMEHISQQLNAPRFVSPKPPTMFPFISSLLCEESSPPASSSSTGAASDQSDSKKATKQEEKEKSKKAKATAAPSKQETAEPAADAKAAGDDADPSKLDIRVGVVLNCWNHPDSEKLLCEEIDVGEEAPRRIGSGIRAFYQAEQLIGRKVFVLANLKERSLAGFPSQGMVLCASNADHSAVALIEPPAGAKAGDRVTFAGYVGDPAPAAQVAKKKILEKVAPDLKTNEAGTPTWRNVLWTDLRAALLQCPTLKYLKY